MKEKLINKMIKAKEDQGIAYVNFFNDGSVSEDERYRTSLLKYANDADGFDTIADTLYRSTESCSRNYDFDSIKMDLMLGLVYEGCDVDENKQIKEDAEPLNGIVRYYTGEVNSYLDNEKTNDYDYGRLNGRQGYINYKNLVSQVKKNGLTFNGPDNFEEFKQSSLSKEPFEVSISANLLEKLPEEEIEEVVEVEETPKSKIKRFLGI